MASPASSIFGSSRVKKGSTLSSIISLASIYTQEKMYSQDPTHAEVTCLIKKRHIIIEEVQMIYDYFSRLSISHKPNTVGSIM